MKKMFSFLFIFFVLGLIMNGCAETEKAVPTQKFSMADYGAKPSVQSYKAKIQAKIQAKLKDPYSAKFKFGNPRRAHYELKHLKGTFIPGWIIPCIVNAKNSYGGYTGQKFWNGFIVNGRKDSSSFLMFVDTLENSVKQRGLVLYPNH